MPNIEKFGNLDLGNPKILFLEGVIFLYKFFTKSVISGSKHPKSENSKICSCLLVLSLCLLMLAREWPCSSRSHSPKSRFWSVSVPFINSSQNRWYLTPNAQNRKIPQNLLVLARAQPVLAHACPWMAVPEPVLTPQNPYLGGCHFPS